MIGIHFSPPPRGNQRVVKVTISLISVDGSKNEEVARLTIGDTRLQPPSKLVLQCTSDFAVV